jgi:hypothetical protein
MEPVPRDVHIFNRLGGIQSGQLHSKPDGMCGLNARRTAGFVVTAQALVADASNHEPQYTSMLRTTQRAQNLDA